VAGGRPLVPSRAVDKPVEAEIETSRRSRAGALRFGPVEHVANGGWQEPALLFTFSVSPF
jgi:hypothetical protein